MHREACEADLLTARFINFENRERLMSGMKKRGVSPVIATVLLVGFVVAIIIIVMLWGKNYIEELAAKRGALAQKQNECQMVSFKIKSAAYGGSIANIVIENQKDTAIDKFIFKGLAGSESQPIEETTKLGGLQLTQYNVDFGRTDITEVDIIPLLKAGVNKYVPCTNKHTVVKLS